MRWAFSELYDFFCCDYFQTRARILLYRSPLHCSRDFVRVTKRPERKKKKYSFFLRTHPRSSQANSVARTHALRRRIPSHISRHVSMLTQHRQRSLSLSLFFLSLSFLSLSFSDILSCRNGGASEEGVRRKETAGLELFIRFPFLILFPGKKSCNSDPGESRNNRFPYQEIATCIWAPLGLATIDMQ